MTNSRVSGARVSFIKRKEREPVEGGGGMSCLRVGGGVSFGPKRAGNSASVSVISTNPRK